MLEISDRPLDPAPVSPEAAWSATEAAWARAVPELIDSLAPRDARHAYAVLRGLTSAGGGMVAAATMSLPERAEAGRNYDYRYAWIRDQCYAGQAVAAGGASSAARRRRRVHRRPAARDGPDMKPAYRIDGGAVPDERTLDHLAGYPGGFDKVGNWVNRQFQLDAFGEALLLFADGRPSRPPRQRHTGGRSKSASPPSRPAGSEPDAGIWELDNQRGPTPA